MKYSWVFILVAVLVVGATGYYFIGPGSKAAPESLKDLEEMTPEEKLRLEIDRAVSGLGGELKQAVGTDEGWIVVAEFTESDLNLEETLEAAQNVFSELGRIDVDIVEAVTLFRSDALRDVYGNQLKDVDIARIGLNGSTFEQVNWKGFEFLNFPRITTDFWLHDELQKQWADLEEKLRAEDESGPPGEAESSQGNNEGGSGNRSSGGGGPA